MQLAFEYHYVLFLDILGYSAIIGGATNGSKGKTDSIANLRDVFVACREIYAQKPGYNIKQFSDSIILSAPFDEFKSDDFISNSASLQRFMLNHGILTRGGLAVGKHFQDQDFIASQAVIDAYHIEQSIAKFPRIVATENFLDLCYPSKDYSSASLASFIDGVCFIDFLRGEDIDSETRRSLLGIWANSGNLDWSAKEKIYWLVEYWNYRQPDSKISLPSRFEFL